MNNALDGYAEVVAENKRLRAELAAARNPKPGLLCGDVAISTDPRYATFVFVRHVDGVSWTTGARLTPETWGMLKASIDAALGKEGS